MSSDVALDRANPGIALRAVRVKRRSIGGRLEDAGRLRYQSEFPVGATLNFLPP